MIRPLNPTSFSDADLRDEQIENTPSPSLTEFAVSAWRTGTLTDEVGALVGAHKLGKLEPFNLTDDIKRNHAKFYTADEASYIEEASSTHDYTFRKERVASLRKDAEVVSAYGVTGFAATMAMSMLDPVSLGAGMVTGGAGKVAHMARTARAIRGAAAGAATGGVSAVFEAEHNPHVTFADVLLQTVAGGGLGAAGGALTQWGRKGKEGEISFKEEADATVAKAMEDAEASSVSSLKDELDKFYAEAAAKKKAEDADVELQAKRKKAEERAKYRKSPMGQLEKGLPKGTDIEAVIKGIEAYRAKKRAEVDAHKGKSDGITELDKKIAAKKKEFADMVAKSKPAEEGKKVKQTPAMKAALKEITELEASVKEARAAYESRFRFGYFDGLHPVLKAEHAFPDGKYPMLPPKKKGRPKKGEPTVEAPKVDEVKTEKPKVEEVKVEAPKAPIEEVAAKVDIPEAVVEVVKKKRGRPKKVADTLIKEAEAAPEGKAPEVKAPEAPVKRGRGRPKKEAKVEPEVSPPVAEVIEAVKKKRGRPPKAQTKAEAEVPEPVVEVAEAPKKKKGRPKKEEVVPEPPKVAEEPVKKKRGRPPKTKEEPVESAPLKSAGAAQNKYYYDFEHGIEQHQIDKLNKILDETEDLKMDNVNVWGDSSFSRLANSLYTSLTSSKNSVVSGMAYKLFENPQGATRTGEVSKYSGSMYAAMMGRHLRTVGGGSFTRNDSFQKYLAANNINVIKGHFDNKIKAKFDREVVFSIVDHKTYAKASKAVQDAADSMRMQFAETVRQMKLAGVRGFENIDPTPNYFPKILHTGQVMRAVRTHGRVTVAEVIAQGYHTGGHKLPLKVARKLAETRLNQLYSSKASLGMDVRSIKTEDLEYLRVELKKAKVDDDAIEAILNSKIGAIEDATITDRALHSFDPSLSAKVDDLSYYDLIHNDTEAVMESFVREAAGDLAMQKTLGVGSYSAATKLLQTAKDVGQRAGHSANIDSEMDMMYAGVRLIYGKSINQGSERLAKNLSRMKSLTSILKLQAMGLTNVGELARVVATQGLGDCLASVKYLNRASVRKLKRKDLEEVDEVYSFAGEDWAFESTRMDTDVFSELMTDSPTMSQKAGQILDQALAGGRRISGITSLFRTTQGVGEKISTRAVVRKLKEGRISEQSARDAGWLGEGRDTLAKLKKFMDANPATFEGKKLLNVDVMKSEAPELLEELRVGVMRLVYRDMQRMQVGELPLHMHKWLGSTLSQFMTFPYASLSKQLIHDARGDRAVAAKILGLSAGMAYALNLARAGLTAASDPSKDFDEVVNERLTGTALGFNLLSTMGQTSSFGLGIDALATIGALPDSAIASKANAFQGGSSYSPAAFSPLSDAYDLGQGIKAGITGDGWSDAGQALHKLLPFAGTLGLSQFIAANTYNKDN